MSGHRAEPRIPWTSASGQLSRQRATSARIYQNDKGVSWLRGMATFGPLMARIVLRGEMVPPGGTDSEWRAMLAFTLDAVAVIS
jgi:hypothetical protein